jgi:hypothetical protein
MVQPGLSALAAQAQTHRVPQQPVPAPGAGDAAVLQGGRTRPIILFALLFFSASRWSLCGTAATDNRNAGLRTWWVRIRLTGTRTGPSHLDVDQRGKWRAMTLEAYRPVDFGASAGQCQMVSVPVLVMLRALPTPPLECPICPKASHVPVHMLPVDTSRQGQ